MSFKTDFIEAIANELAAHGRKTSGTNIAKALNNLGIKTKCGKMYSGKRGTYKIVNDAYNAAVARGDTQTAKNIATTITLPNGKAAWQKKYPPVQSQNSQTSATSVNNP